MNATADDLPLVSILVVTYKQHRLLARCLDRIREATRGLATETIMVVNGVPLQPEHRAAAANGTTLLHAPVNLGLPGGLQWARSEARGRYLAVVQDDVEVGERWVEPLLEVLERDETVGAVGSRIALIDGTPWADGMVVPRSGWVHLVEPAPRPDPHWAVDMSFSASSLVRADAWDSVGGPNPRLYPNQNVDVDLGLRLATADWSVMVARDSLVRHVRNASTPARKLHYLLVRNHRKLLRDHEHVLAERPENFAEAGAVDAWLTHLAVLAERRRTRVPPHRTPRPATPLPILVRDARTDARQVRVGEALFPVRVGVHHLRHSVLRWFRQIRERAPSS